MKRNDRATKNGLKVFHSAKKALADIGWDPQSTEIEGVLRIDFGADNISISEALVDVRIEYERFLFYLNFKTSAPPKYRNATMEFITRANFDLVIGNFEINLKNGSVRFKSSFDFTLVDVDEKLIKNSIKSAMDVVDLYSESLEEVIKGNKKPEQAIIDAELGEQH